MDESIDFKHSENDEVIVRSNITLSLFTRLPQLECGERMAAVFDQWVALVDDNYLQWSLIGGNATSYKPINKNTIKRCQEQLVGSKAEKREMNYFELFGSTKYAPDWLFSAECSNDLNHNLKRDKNNYINIRLPISMLQEPEPLINWVLTVVDNFPLTGGYMAPSLVPGHESVEDEAGQIIGPRAKRYPGYDVCNNRFTAWNINDQHRGARWMTLLGNE